MYVESQWMNENFKSVVWCMKKKREVKENFATLQTFTEKPKNKLFVVIESQFCKAEESRY